MEAKSARLIWETALGELEIQVSKPNYRTFLEKTKGLSFNDSEFTIGVPNIFVAEYLDKSQRSLIERTLINILHQDIKVSFTVNPAPRITGTGRESAPPAPVNRLRLNPRYTFDSFVVGECNRLAYAAAEEVVKCPGQSYNPLFIYGSAGMGKTHLLQAIGHAAQTNLQVIYVSGEKFTNEFISAIQGKHMDNFRTRFRGCDLLLIDDIQFISGKEQTEECFFHTFNELHNGSKQIVMTCDRSPRELPALSERLRSRFSWGLEVDMLPPDTDTRRRILKLKAGREGTDLTPDILDLIAGEVKQNIRELEGSLNRVIAYARLLQTALTRELAASALADIAARREKPDAGNPTLIIQAVADSFRLSVEDLTGRRRDKEVALAREVAMYLLRQRNGCSLAEIGRSLGGRNPSTVSHGYARIESELPDSPYLRQKLTSIDSILATHS